MVRTGFSSFALNRWMLNRWMLNRWDTVSLGYCIAGMRGSVIRKNLTVGGTRWVLFVPADKLQNPVELFTCLLLVGGKC